MVEVKTTQKSLKINQKTKKFSSKNYQQKIITLNYFCQVV